MVFSETREYKKGCLCQKYEKKEILLSDCACMRVGFETNSRGDSFEAKRSCFLARDYDFHAKKYFFIEFLMKIGCTLFNFQGIRFFYLHRTIILDLILLTEAV